METDRLRLREFTGSDLDALVELHADPETIHFWPRPPSRDELARQLLNSQYAYEQDGFDFWAVELRDDGRFIGRIGLARRFVNGKGEIEVGYMLRREDWGHGYATEAARACRDWAFQRLGVARVISLIRPGNLRSVEVAKRNGMKRVGETTHAGMPHDVYAIERAEWKGLTSRLN